MSDQISTITIYWLEVFRKTSSIRNGPKLAAFPAYLGVRKHLGLTLAFREVAADFLAHLRHVRLFGLFEMTPPTVERLAPAFSNGFLIYHNALLHLRNGESLLGSSNLSFFERIFCHKIVSPRSS